MAETHPGTSQVQLADRIAPANFSYTASPVNCDGVTPPPAKTQADAAAYAGSPEVTAQYLDYSCDWDVAFTAAPACAAAFVWGSDPRQPRQRNLAGLGGRPPAAGAPDPH